MKTGMRTGLYKIYNSVYGEIGEAIDIDRLLEELDGVWTSYNQFLSGTILGFIWRGSDYKVAEKLSKQSESIRRNYREKVKQTRLDREKRIAKRLRRK